MHGLGKQEKDGYACGRKGGSCKRNLALVNLHVQLF
jgi:hypothetical protein